MSASVKTTLARMIFAWNLQKCLCPNHEVINQGGCLIVWELSWGANLRQAKLATRPSLFGLRHNNANVGKPLLTTPHSRNHHRKFPPLTPPRISAPYIRAPISAPARRGRRRGPVKNWTSFLRVFPFAGTGVVRPRSVRFFRVLTGVLNFRVLTKFFPFFFLPGTETWFDFHRPSLYGRPLLAVPDNFCPWFALRLRNSPRNIHPKFPSNFPHRIPTTRRPKLAAEN